MDPIENDVDASPEKPASSRSNIVLALLIVGVQVLVALVFYPFSPDQVPVHWNVTGQINGYASKLSLFLWPLLSFVLFFLIRFLVQIGPRLGQVNQRVNLVLVERLLVGMVLFFLAVQLITIAAALHLPIDTTFIAHLLMGVLFIFLGNYMGKLRRNFWAGIRTPWTLASEVVWERTHRLGGWLFVLAGVLLLALGFIPALRAAGTVVILVLLVGGLAVYSYLIYRKEERSGRNPLSSPFDREG